MSTCQHETSKRVMSDVVYEYVERLEVCGEPVRDYRQCGRGCQHLAVFCAEHGGDGRSQRAMIEHHEKVHQFVYNKEVLP